MPIKAILSDGIACLAFLQISPNPPAAIARLPATTGTIIIHWPYA